MKRIAKFEKVSLKQFSADWKDTFGDVTEEKIQEIYDQIRLPRRATAGSAGYDFFAPVDVQLAPGETIKIPTGIRAQMEQEWVLKVYPRSGLGFKYRLQMNNTVGIIDSDYFYSDNEDIFMKIRMTDGRKNCGTESRRRICSGVFLEYGVMDDDATEKRNGGFGRSLGNSLFCKAKVKFKIQKIWQNPKIFPRM